jgi:hypothetical protein
VKALKAQELKKVQQSCEAMQRLTLSVSQYVQTRKESLLQHQDDCKEVLKSDDNSAHDMERTLRKANQVAESMRHKCDEISKQSAQQTKSLNRKHLMLQELTTREFIQDNGTSSELRAALGQKASKIPRSKHVSPAPLR